MHADIFVSERGKNVISAVVGDTAELLCSRNPFIENDVFSSK